MPYLDLHFLCDVDQNEAKDHQECAKSRQPRGQRAVNQQVRDHREGDGDGHADGGDGGGGEHHGAGQLAGGAGQGAPGQLGLDRRLVEPNVLCVRRPSAARC